MKNIFDQSGLTDKKDENELKNNPIVQESSNNKSSREEQTEHKENDNENLKISEGFISKLFTGSQFKKKINEALEKMYEHEGSEFGSIIFFDEKEHKIDIPDPIGGDTWYSTKLSQLIDYGYGLILGTFHLHPTMGTDPIIYPSKSDLVCGNHYREKNKNEEDYDFPPMEIIISRISKENSHKEFKMLIYQEPLKYKINVQDNIFNATVDTLYQASDQKGILGILRGAGYKCLIVKTKKGEILPTDIKKISSTFFANIKKNQKK